MTGVKGKKFLSTIMTICLIFTLLPMYDIQAEASETDTEEYNEMGKGAKAMHDEDITMATSEAEKLYDV